MRGFIICLLCLGAASAALVTPPPAPLKRRQLIAQAAALSGAVLASNAARPASASMAGAIREAEQKLLSSSTTDGVTEALGELLTVAEEYEGLPSNALKEELVGAMRSKRTSLQGMNPPVWTGVPEEAYNRLMRKVDPWRVTELKPIAQFTFAAFGPVYIAILFVQQLLPGLFAPAYALGAAFLLGPLLFQTIVG